MLPAKTIPSVFLMTMMVMLSPGQAQEEAVDNEALYRALGPQGHSIMKAQRERIVELIDGFLVGDWVKIRRGLRQMSYDIRRIAERFAADGAKGQGREEALESLLKHAKLLEVYVEAEEYRKAYDQFIAITKRCIECHQTSRSWGVFEGEEEETPKEDARGSKSGEKQYAVVTVQ